VLDKVLFAFGDATGDAFTASGERDRKEKNKDFGEHVQAEE
jgi:hypothetical protein